MTRKAGIIGGGIMGSGLARYFLAQDYLVSLVEADTDLVEKVRRKVEKSFSKEVEKGKLNPEAKTKWLANFSVGTDPSLLGEAEIVIEAVPEDLELKKQILATAEKALRHDTIIASNTSALPISALATALSRPERFIGTHFFNPAHIMPLVEVVPGMDTISDVVCRVLDILSTAGKKPIRIKECPGFLVNRVLGAYMNEAMWLLEETAGIMELEGAAKELGLPMGPAALGDMAGWDVIHAANQTLAAAYGERFEVPSLLTKLDIHRRHGTKTGKGLFDHSAHPARPTEDCAPISRNLDQDGLETVKTRLTAALLAESLRCLDEGVAAAADLDRAMMMGAGLRQGPLHRADEIGLDAVLEQLERLTQKFGSRFWPAPILRIYVLAGYLGPSTGRGLAGKY